MLCASYSGCLLGFSSGFFYFFSEHPAARAHALARASPGHAMSGCHASALLLTDHTVPSAFYSGGGRVTRLVFSFVCMFRSGSV